MNRYSPYYDHDENCTRMDLHGEGSWVHVTTAQVAMRERDEARAEVEVLKKELDNLRVVVVTLRAEREGTGPHPYRITACPRCCGSALYYSKSGSVEAKCQITCRDCNWKRYD